MIRTHSIKIFLIGAITFLLTNACSTYSEKELQAFDEAIREYISANNLQMERLENGMYYKITDLGEGDEFIRLTDKVTFSYIGSFLTGEVFQKITHHNPLTFKVRELIVGWQDALTLIKPSGSINIILPPQLGYGDKKLELVPANSILIYELTVLNVE